MECPRCNTVLRFRGLARTNPKSDMRVVTYQCDMCENAYIKAKRNPSNEDVIDGKVDGKRLPKKYGQAIKLFEDFNMKPVDKVFTIDISLPNNQKNPLVWLGKISQLTYISDKEGTKGQRYVHDLEYPLPDFFVTADKKTFVIAGGKMTVKDGWLYY